MPLQVKTKKKEQQQGKAITLALTFDLMKEMNTPGFMNNILQTLLLDKYQVRHTTILFIQMHTMVQAQNHFTQQHIITLHFNITHKPRNSRPRKYYKKHTTPLLTTTQHSYLHYSSEQ
jgi:hypothetical protein